MTAGMQDYQKIIRPRYGSAKRKAFAGRVIGNADNTLMEVSGRGMIYGGSLQANLAANQEKSSAIMDVDGSEISLVSFYLSRFAGENVDFADPFYLLKFDNVNYEYSFGISKGITFETSFKIVYREFYNDTPLVSCRIIYALI